MKRASPTKSARLAEKLKRIRVELELSQSELLDRLGFSEHLFRSNISQYGERGHRIPSLPVLLEYARVVNVDLSVLIDDRLDLPHKLPYTAKRKRISRSSKAGKKR
jgi:transcriptional regulator with XRE-family HTH domain